MAQLPKNAARFLFSFFQQKFVTKKPPPSERSLSIVDGIFSTEGGLCCKLGTRIADAFSLLLFAGFILHPLLPMSRDFQENY